mmetsp:Transcript_6014/g.14245  ORF Transcript_6014/g.14245 Transcript_6014/m.14245 type:complete len:82 (-) Transcript_6014:2494-2739(-)
MLMRTIFAALSLISIRQEANRRADCLLIMLFMRHKNDMEHHVSFQRNKSHAAEADKLTYEVTVAPLKSCFASCWASCQRFC